jgi:hypothetical protein
MKGADYGIGSAPAHSGLTLIPHKVFLVKFGLVLFVFVVSSLVDQYYDLHLCLKGIFYLLSSLG